MNTKYIEYYYQAEDFFFRSLSKETLDFDDKASIYITGVLSPHLNLLILKKYIFDFDVFLGKINEIFKTKNLPFCVVIQETLLDTKIESVLKEKSFTSEEMSAAMIFDLTQEIQWDKNDKIIIQRIDGNTLEKWAIPVKEAFEASTEIMNQYRLCHEKNKNKSHFYHFSLFENNVPVASVTLSVNNTLARVDDGGTLINYRRKGYLTLLLYHALETAKELGAEYCFTDAAEQGQAVCQKMGFNLLFKNKILQRK
jgi:hypothetical protein